MTNFTLPYHHKPHPKRLAAAEREAVLTDPGFGQTFTDHMVSIDWDLNNDWHNARVEPFGPLQLSPSSVVLHYGQEIFEGMKAYRHQDGTIHVFRPNRHAARFRKSAERMALPKLPVEDFMASITEYVRADHDWVPAAPGTSLYIRPFMFANEVTFGVHATTSAEYHVIGSPAASYFKGDIKPISAWVETHYARAAARGTGFAKTGGNYAGAMAANHKAAAAGCEQVLFLDAAQGAFVEELSSMNLFVVDKNNVIRTPKLTGAILDGVTRDSILQLAADLGYHVREENIRYDDLLSDIRIGYVTEMFATGTAAVVTSIGTLRGEQDLDLQIGDGGNGPCATELRQHLTDIQYGRTPDPYGWLHKIDF